MYKTNIQCYLPSYLIIDVSSSNLCRDSGMSCVGQPSIPDGYPTGAASGTPPTVTFVCNPGYTLSGNPTYTCDTSAKTPHWTGNAECIPWYIKDGTVKFMWSFAFFFFNLNDFFQKCTHSIVFLFLHLVI